LILVRKKFSASSLTSAKIIGQRSAVPAVFSRTTAKSDTPKRKRVTQAEKDRLLRIAKRPRKGPFGIILDESEDKWAGAAASQGAFSFFSSVVNILHLCMPGCSLSFIAGVSAAVKSSGHYDPWASSSTTASVDTSTSSSASKAPVTDFIKDVVMKPAPKAPIHSQNLEHPHKLISMPAVPAPHAGTSYNPPVDAHQELLRKAVEIEEKREEKRAKEGEVKEKMVKARTLEDGEEGALGMVVGKPDEHEEEDEDEVPEWQGVVKQQQSRKTKAQRKKAAKILAEVCLTHADFCQAY